VEGSAARYKMHRSIIRHLRQQPVFVTGWGSACASGVGAKRLFDATLKGWSLATRSSFSGDQGDQIGCFLPPDLEAQLSGMRRHDPVASLGLIAARDAIQSAGLDDDHLPTAGIIAGTSRGPIASWAKGDSDGRAGKRIRPSTAANSTLASLSGTIALELGMSGPTMTVSATCASSAHAIATGAEQILLGNADIVLVGGADLALHPLVVAQMNAAGVVAGQGMEPEDPNLACRPFDRDRSGMILGEGAGFLVLESAASVAKRGANPLASLLGWALGTGNGGRSAVDPNGTDLLEVSRKALNVAEVEPGSLGYINAHGTGTRMNDSAEAQTYRSLLGDAADRVAVSSTKPVTGHCLGGTAVLEAIVAIAVLREGVAPPTPGLVNRDPATEGLRLIAGRPAPINEDPGVVLSNSSGFWSTHASLVFGRA